MVFGLARFGSVPFDSTRLYSAWLCYLAFCRNFEDSPSTGNPGFDNFQPSNWSIGWDPARFKRLQSDMHNIQITQPQPVATRMFSGKIFIDQRAQAIELSWLEFWSTNLHHICTMSVGGPNSKLAAGSVAGRKVLMVLKIPTMRSQKALEHYCWILVFGKASSGAKQTVQMSSESIKFIVDVIATSRGESLELWSLRVIFFDILVRRR